MIASSHFPSYSQNLSESERRQVKFSCHPNMQTAMACRWKEEKYRTLIPQRIAGLKAIRSLRKPIMIPYRAERYSSRLRAMLSVLDT
jgi:hypothetical protein